MQKAHVADGWRGSTELERDPIFENHLAFLGAHRGRLKSGRAWVGLDGKAGFLSFLAPLSDAAEVPADCSTLWTYPWSGRGWPERLPELGFAPADRMSYMQQARPQQPRTADNHAIGIVSGDAEAREFAAVQSRAFLTEELPARDWWVACFEEMALRNYAEPHQTLYMACVGGDPAAVLLSMRTGAVTGVYAVATAPEYRMLGLSTALLGRATDEAIARGAGTIVLQAIVGQYAEGFYARASFERRYLCQVWRRP